MRQKNAFLPPVGRVPVRDTALGSATGVNLSTFFGSRYDGLPHVIGIEEVVPLVRRAFRHVSRPLRDLDAVDVLVTGTSAPVEALAGIEKAEPVT